MERRFCLFTFAVQYAVKTSKFTYNRITTMNFLTNFTITKFCLCLIIQKLSFCSHCMMSYNFWGQCYFCDFHSLSWQFETYPRKVDSSGPLILFIQLHYYRLLLYLIEHAFFEDMWIKGWDISVKHKHILFYLLILLLFPRYEKWTHEDTV